MRLGTVGLLCEPGDSLWIPVTRAVGGQLREACSLIQGWKLPALAPTCPGPL